MYQPFVFHLRNAESDHELCCRLNVDGQVASNPFLSSTDRSWRVCSGMRTSTETERVFRFSSIQFTGTLLFFPSLYLTLTAGWCIESDPDEGGVTEAKWDFSQIGVIEFVVWRGINTRRRLQQPPPSRTLHGSPVPEKSKKAGWHRVASVNMHCSFADDY